MRRILVLLLSALLLLSCQCGKTRSVIPSDSVIPSEASVIPSEAKESVSGYWQRHDWHIGDNIDATEDQFASFAELAAAAPDQEAIAALGELLDSLKANDAVAYYIYAGWLEGAFYNPFSHCRNAALFTYAVGRIETDGIFSPDECRPLQQKRDWIALNREGTVAITPEPDPEGRRTLVLVIDLSCPSCRNVLETLGSDPEWKEDRHIALCCGDSALPTVPGWEYRPVGNPFRYFDLMMTPVYYVIDPAGVVVQSYQPAL